MKIAIYGKTIPEKAIKSLVQFCESLQKAGFEIWLHTTLQPFFEAFPSVYSQAHFFDRSNKPLTRADMLISIGGDGTMLDSVSYIHDLGTPILGINTGRLGFLASIGPEDLDLALDYIISGNYKTEERTVLEVQKPVIEPKGFALNEITVLKKDSSSMLTIHVEVNGEFLCDYWADGLIISTPTGSTAYSLSCGGPIVLPGSNNLIITPIAPHNLTVRPMVLPDHAPISIRVEGRGDQFLMAMDSKTVTLDMGTEIVLQKADFTVNLMQPEGVSFFKTLRNKLMWGIDKRN